MADPLRIGVAICGAWALAAITSQVLRARSYGRRPLYAPPAGDPVKAILYAFGPGMSPTAKESVREHISAYLAGMGYHLGIFTSMAILAVQIAGGAASGPVLLALRMLSLTGAVCGLTLLARRLVTAPLRGLSSPDDYIANALVTAFAALALASTLSAAALPILLAESMILFLYLPLGKIRHCFFFFTTRSAAAAQFGRRGTWPPAHSSGRG